MKAISKAIFILFLCTLFAKVSFAQEQASPSHTTSSITTATQKNSEESIDSILSDFNNLNWEARKQKFPTLLAQIEQLKLRPDKDLLLARLYLMAQGENKENLKKACLLTEDLLKKNPKAFNGYLILATTYIDKMSFDTYFVEPSKWTNKDDIKLRKQALQAIEKSLAINDKYAEGYRLKATLSEGEEKNQLLEKAISLNPAYDEAWRDLSNFLIEKKRYDEAVNKLSLWVKNTQSRETIIEIFIKSAEVFRDKKEFYKAERFLKIALEARQKSGSDALERLYSGIDEIYSSLAYTYLDAKNYKNAEEYFQNYLEIHPKDWYVRFDLARLYSDTNQKDKAIVQYEQVLAYNESNTSSIYNLGLLYKDSDKEKAKELFTKYIKLTIDSDTEDSQKWVTRAKDNLNDLGVYEYPKSKKELNDAKLEKIKVIFAILILFILIFLSWKFKKVTKWVILSLMVLAIVIISLIEANEGEPSFVRAILYFIPVMSIGGFFLYLLRNRKCNHL